MIIAVVAVFTYVHRN